MNWFRIAASVVAFQYLAALVIGSAVGFVYPMPIYGLASIGLWFLVLVLAGYSAWRVYVRRREDDLFKAVASDIASVSDFPLTVFLVCAQMAVLGWLKAMMPHAVGFWADPALADLDAVIFGTDPWKLLHPAPQWFATLMDQGYMTWAFVTFTMLAALGLAGQSEARDRALIAWFVMFAIGGLGQYLLPSAGPVFYEAVGHGNRFASMPDHPWVQHIAAHLWEAYSSQARVGSGISAMPSLHVAGAAWVALCLGSFAPKLKWMGWAYFVTILVGSVYLGWHYAVDGLAGLGLALAAWKLAGLRIEPSFKFVRRIA